MEKEIEQLRKEILELSAKVINLQEAVRQLKRERDERNS